MAYDTRALRGIGGWLAFFVLTLTVFTPIGAVMGVVGNIYSDATLPAAYGARWPLIQGSAWLQAAGVIGGAWFMAWRLIRVQTWRSVVIVIGGLWILAVFPTIFDLVTVALIAQVSIGLLISESGFALIQPLFYSAIWSAYLLRSERVANTYARYGDDSDLVAVFD